MNFFAAIKQYIFASKLFASIGFDFEKAFAANDEAALKAHYDAAPKPAEVDPKLTEALNEAVAENASLAKQVTELTANATAGAALCTALAAQGIEISRDEKGALDVAKFKSAYDLHLATLVRTECAKVGVKPIAETPGVSDPTSASADASKAKTPELHGFDRYRASIFNTLSTTKGTAA